MKRFLLICILLSYFGLSFAQIPGEKVYLHNDRDVYGSSDELNFKAYLKNSPDAVSKSSKLFVCMLNPAGSPVASEIFPVANNQATGSIALPDTLGEGEHRILGYTDQMKKGSPQDVFTKKIFIGKNEIQGLCIKLTPDAPWYLPGDYARLGIHISFQDKQPYTNDTFTYLVSKNGIPYQNGIGKTDAEGNAGLLIKIPSDTVEGLILVAVSAEYRKYHGSVSVPIPAGGMPVFLNFLLKAEHLLMDWKRKWDSVRRITWEIH